MVKYKYYYIYLITNKITGKQYVGQHRSNSLKNTYMGSSKSLNDEIKVIGVENFKKEILEIFSHAGYLDKLEAYYIGKYNTYENGYNRTRTGSFDETKKIIFANPTYKYKCPHCNKKGNTENFRRAHFDQCGVVSPKMPSWKMFDKAN